MIKLYIASKHINSYTKKLYLVTQHYMMKNLNEFKYHTFDHYKNLNNQVLNPDSFGINNSEKVKDYYLDNRKNAVIPENGILENSMYSEYGGFFLKNILGYEYLSISNSNYRSSSIHEKLDEKYLIGNLYNYDKMIDLSEYKDNKLIESKLNFIQITKLVGSKKIVLIKTSLVNLPNYYFLNKFYDKPKNNKFLKLSHLFNTDKFNYIKINPVNKNDIKTKKASLNSYFNLVIQNEINSILHNIMVEKLDKPKLFPKDTLIKDSIDKNIIIPTQISKLFDIHKKEILKRLEKNNLFEYYTNYYDKSKLFIVNFKPKNVKLPNLTKEQVKQILEVIKIPKNIEVII